jgi:ribosomal protein L9
MTVSELQAKREEILESISNPVEDMRFAERSVRYRSMEQLKESLREIDAEIAKALGSEGRLFTLQTKRGIE